MTNEDLFATGPIGGAGQPGVGKSSPMPDWMCGRPGESKSEFAENIAKRDGLELIEVRVAMDPKEREAWDALAKLDELGYFLFDELDSATPEMVALVEKMSGLPSPMPQTNKLWEMATDYAVNDIVKGTVFLDEYSDDSGKTPAAVEIVVRAALSPEELATATVRKLESEKRPRWSIQYPGKDA